jgi:hypothetical protein
MAGPKVLRGRNVELQLLANNGSGTTLAPVFFATVTGFNAAERGTEDTHEFIGSQADEPDKDIAGYGGSFTMEIREKEMLRLEERIAQRQFNNQEDLDIRIIDRMKFTDGTVSGRTYRECVLTFDRQVSSRAGFNTVAVNWRSGGLPGVE